MNEAKWYVAHTYSGYERKVSSEILKAADTRKMTELILETTIPTEDVTELTEDNKEKTVTRLIYPGYVFIKMVATDPRAWHLVRNIRGVTGFVGEENKPVPLTDNEIVTLGVERKKEYITAYEIDDLVSITDGPCAGFSGRITKVDLPKGRVKVLVPMLFGRDTEVELKLDEIEKE